MVVEVLSPTSSTRDYVRKPRIAAAAGVPEYWVADPGTGELARHTLVEGRDEVELVDTLPFPYTIRPTPGPPPVPPDDDDARP